MLASMSLSGIFKFNRLPARHSVATLLRTSSSFLIAKRPQVGPSAPRSFITCRWVAFHVSTSYKSLSEMHCSHSSQKPNLHTMAALLFFLLPRIKTTSFSCCSAVCKKSSNCGATSSIIRSKSDGSKLCCHSSKAFSGHAACLGLVSPTLRAESSAKLISSLIPLTSHAGLDKMA